MANVDKGLYQVPEGVVIPTPRQVIYGDAESEDGVTMLEDGGIEIDLSDNLEEETLTEEIPFDANLAEYLDDDQLNTIATDLIELVDADVMSRKEWVDVFVEGMDAIGLKYEHRMEPWENACGVHSTILAEAAIRFQAETMSETFPAAGPVKTKILGEETREKQAAAERVRADMNYELTEVMVEYRPEHERMLYTLGLAGSAFKKVYYDPVLGRQTAVYCPPEDVIVPFGASHIEAAERVTHVLRKTKNEMRKLQASGFYTDIELGDPLRFHSDIETKKAEQSGYTLVDDERYALYEIHVEMCIEGIDKKAKRPEKEDDESGEGIEGIEAEVEADDYDDMPKPYVVTIEKGTNKILAIRRNWKPDDELKRKRQYFVHYVYIPGFGFYGMGLIHVIGGYARAGTSLIRQLVDAGTISNLPAGLKTRGMRIKGDDTPIPPGVFRDVDVPSGTIKENIMTLPYKEPSQTLLALLERITEEGRRLGAIAEMNISDMSANAPVGTTLAILERVLKPMAAVQARVHYAMKQEFKLLKAIIAEYAPEEYGYQPDRAEPRARRDDYATVEVIPVSDPNNTTMAQRVVQYQTAMQMAQQAPQIYDLKALHRQTLEVLGVKNADKIVPMPEDMPPTDPVSENMAALVGKPVKAFIYQDHDAHIMTHQSFMQDPQIAAFIGQNPAAQQIMGALQAHIAEHIAFSYRKQIEDKLGVTLGAPNDTMPEEQEILLSQVMADAARQVTTQKQQAAAQQQAQQQAQDPVFQQQQRETAIKEAEVQRKAAKDAADGARADKKLVADTVLAAAELQATNAQEDKRLATEALKVVTGGANSGEKVGG